MKEYLRLLFAGRSGKPCLTKHFTFLWLSCIITWFSYLIFSKGTWPQNVPDAVYYSLAFILGIKTYGDIKLSKNNDQSISPPLP